MIAEVIALPGSFGRRNLRKHDSDTRTTEQLSIAVLKISKAIFELKDMRSAANAGTVDILISELGLIRDGFQILACQNPSDQMNISSLTIRLAGVSAGLEALKASETLRQFAKAIAPDSETGNPPRNENSRD